MSERPQHIDLPRSSRQRYRQFVEDYKHRRLDDPAGSGSEKKPSDDPTKEPEGRRRGKRREYLREYIRWLWPHRYGVLALMLLALGVAGLEMVEPLFMRFVVDRVLLNTGLDNPSRLTRLHLAGGAFLAVVVL